MFVRNYVVIDTFSEKTAPLNQNDPCPPPPVSLPRPAPFPSPDWLQSTLSKTFPYLYPSTQILGITSTLYAYENGR